MDFLQTFLPAFFIWQSLSLCPFALTKNALKPKLNRFHNCLSIFSAIIQLAAFVYGVWNYRDYTSLTDRSMVIFIADVTSMAFIRCISITIVIESWLKRSHQIEFLTKIDQIDRMVRTKLSIDLPYKRQQKQNLRNLFVWIGAQVGLESSIPFMNSLDIYWAFYTVPLFFSVMRYLQFVLYVNLLYIRFEALNECIERLKLTKYRNAMDLNYGNGCSKFDAHFSYFQSAMNARHVETSMIVNQLKYIQITYRSLVEANQMLCKLFNWSMLLNVGNDFSNLVLNGYWMIINIIQKNSKFELIGVCSWATFNVVMITTLANACQSATNEVYSVIQKDIGSIFQF